MELGHQLVGYDAQSERQAVAVDVPAERFRDVAEIAGVAASDPDAIGCYPLTGDQVRRIADLVGVGALPARTTYFLEPAPAGD